MSKAVQPDSRTLDEWAQSLAAARGHSVAQWTIAIMRSIKRGTLSFFIESTCPRIPRARRAEIESWIRDRFHPEDLEADDADLPKPKAPRSFRHPAGPGAGRHASRLTIGIPRR